MKTKATPAQVERWDVFELALEGPQGGNPFTEATFGARFQQGHRAVVVDGFYDGEGVYRLRFMPDTEGEWRYVTHSNCSELAGREGTLTCTPAGEGNHGPVRVRDTYHLAYADGTPHRSIGTTCYAWIHQGDEMEERTLAALNQSPFNKLRMCVFPKHYRYNANEPAYYPYERGRDGGWDFTRFHPPFWRHLERRVADLCALGIEADVILFHPYDRWGFADMGVEADDLYLRYVVARLAAYRNVWWSLANEFDIMRTKKMADWDRFFRIVQTHDPYQHLRSVHNCRGFYDHAKPWVTHQSIQHSDLSRTDEWRALYRKPVVVDECCYEGDLAERWGNISARELVHRFWEGTARGGYVGHGETYRDPKDLLWWSKGGVLRGQSPVRIAFLRRVLEEGPTQGLDPQPAVAVQGHACAGVAGAYYLIYTGVHQPGEMHLRLPEEGRFSAEVLDPWEMTIMPAADDLSGDVVVPLPARPYQALRVVRQS